MLDAIGRSLAQTKWAEAVLSELCSELYLQNVLWRPSLRKAEVQGA